MQSFAECGLFYLGLITQLHYLTSNSFSISSSGNNESVDVTCVINDETRGFVAVDNVQAINRARIIVFVFILKFYDLWKINCYIMLSHVYFSTPNSLKFRIIIINFENLNPSINSYRIDNMRRCAEFKHNR